MTHTDTMSLDLYGHVDLEDVNCRIEIEIETYEAEPYSWGGSRGTETSVSVSITGATIGELELTRDQLVLMFGEDALRRAESAASDNVDAQDLAA